jgi:hypothetical protein
MIGVAALYLSWYRWRFKQKGVVPWLRLWKDARTSGVNVTIIGVVVMLSTWSLYASSSLPPAGGLILNLIGALMVLQGAYAILSSGYLLLNLGSKTVAIEYGRMIICGRWRRDWRALQRIKHGLVIPIQFPVSGCRVGSRWILGGVYDYLRPGFQN